MTDAYEYLSSIRAVEIRIQMKISQMRQLRDRVTDISAPQLEKDHVSHTKDPAGMEKTMAMLIDIQEEIDQQTCELVARKTEALCLLDRLKAEDARILSAYYLKGESTKEQSKLMFLSRRQVQRKLKKALQEFQMVLSQKVPRTGSSHHEG